MGMFDTLHAPCPRCGTIVTEQTKMGPCLLNDYYHDTTSPREQALFLGESFFCNDCGVKFEVKKLALHSVEIREGEDEK